MQTSWANFAKALDPGPGLTKLVTRGGNNQVALNVLNVEAGRVGKPVLRNLMGEWGGAGRCYSVVDGVLGFVNMLPWR